MVLAKGLQLQCSVALGDVYHTGTKSSMHTTEDLRILQSTGPTINLHAADGVVVRSSELAVCCHAALRNKETGTSGVVSFCSGWQFILL
jgi:hypothetical protein